MPLPVIVTCAFEVAVEPPVTYCTLIVQLPPGATIVPELQVPPAAIENTPETGPDDLVIVGAEVKVNAPVAAAEFDTVMVPFLVPVPPVFTAGEGAEIAMIAPVTVKVTGAVVPLGADTVML